ncbi:hypothetical protein JBW_03790 [Pelosinus fermentans JBW45]|uniref:Uncharacterized protein n=1 Tax=Pelosinus fermentans JBW45 TaxID=1192197 RepID=I8TZD6_9FIRM|nr:hypothetical protein JBW_03790 [Pelosinus fermentans JBW45]
MLCVKKELFYCIVSRGLYKYIIHCISLFPEAINLSLEDILGYSYEVVKKKRPLCLHKRIFSL